jgi:hypothetical protein
LKLKARRPPAQRAVAGAERREQQLTRLDRRAVADRLAEIGGLQIPTRDETAEFLVEVLLKALRQIPSSGAAWSWGEFHNGGIQPLFDISREQDWQRLAVCAVDLGLDGQPARTRPGEVLTPRAALSRNLTRATEQLLHIVRERLEAAGVSPYGEPTIPPSA